MGSVLSAASWASCCLAAWLAAGFLRPAPSFSSPSSEAGAAESARTDAAPTLLQLPVSHARRKRTERACIFAFGWQLQEHAGALKKCQNAKWPSDAFSDSPCRTRACVNLAPVCGLVVLSVCAELTARAHAESLCVCLYVCGMCKVFSRTAANKRALPFCAGTTRESSAES